MTSRTLQLYLWPQRLLFIGPPFDTASHRHHAAQLSIGLQGPLKVRGDIDEPWQQATAFYVPPDTAHGFDAGNSACALLYLDPESTDCEQACRRFGGRGIQLLDDLASPLTALRQLARGEGDSVLAEQACTSLLGQNPRNSKRLIEPRLQRALDWLHTHLDDDIRLATVATASGVSESWLSHRFSEVIGLPLRRYVLWRRLRLATSAALEGASLTDAAHIAGFADSAHFTRSFRDAFGVAPSFLFGARGAIRVELLQ